MHKKPLFSIIVANYNNGKYLPKLIETVQAQTYDNWELVIVDDKSTDDSIAILKPFLNDRIRLIEHSSNAGAGAAFRTAAANAYGEIVGMLGADDGLPEHALQVIIDAYERFPKASTIYTRCLKCDSEDLSPIEVFQYSRGRIDNYSIIFDEYPLNYNFQTFRLSCYLQTNGFDSTLGSAVDQDIFLKLEEVGEAHFIDQPIYYYRIHPNGISQSKRNFNRVMANVLLTKICAYYRRVGTPVKNLSPEQLNAFKAKRYRFLTLISCQQEKNSLSAYWEILSYFSKSFLYRSSFRKMKPLLKVVLKRIVLNKSDNNFQSIHI